MRPGPQTLIAVVLTVASARAGYSQVPVTAGDTIRAELRECGASITLPAEWTAIRIEPADSLYYKDSECRIGLKAATWDKQREVSVFELGSHAIVIRVFPGMVSDSGLSWGFSLDTNGVCWFIGRMGIRTAAMAITVNGCQAFKGKRDIGRLRRNKGGYGGMDEEFAALIVSGDGRLAVITSDSQMKDEKAFDEIVHSFVFRTGDG